jgi:putative Mg2+ transporter-C (MgtC) family protein
VATGMGFLGAGTIIRHGNVVRGLTTAASLWAVAAIGLCVAIGGEAFWVAGMATVIVLLTLTLLRRLETTVVPRARMAVLTMRAPAGGISLEAIRQALSAHGVSFESVEVSRIGPGGVQETQIQVGLPGGCDLASLGSDLAKLDGFVSMQCE